MRLRLVWIEEPGFGGFGCSDCGWRFKLSEEPTGTSFDQMMEKFAMERDKAFTSHVCADTPKKVE
jgi:hypothetical protein